MQTNYLIPATFHGCQTSSNQGLIKQPWNFPPKNYGKKRATRFLDVIVAKGCLNFLGGVWQRYSTLSGDVHVNSNLDQPGTVG